MSVLSTVAVSHKLTSHWVSIGLEGPLSPIREEKPIAPREPRVFLAALCLSCVMEDDTWASLARVDATVVDGANAASSKVMSKSSVKSPLETLKRKHSKS